MKTKTFSVGMFCTNCHVVFCHETGEAVIIDRALMNNMKQKEYSSS